MEDFDGVQICAAKDNVGNRIASWPMKDVSVYASGQLGGIDVADAMEQALPVWNEVSGVNLHMTTNSRTANIGVDFGRIDGPNGTLAWSELPVGFTSRNMRQLRQKYDTSERFVIAKNPPRGKIDLVRVMAHEIGHAIGISHIGNGNLMQPAYSVRIRTAQAGDITQARARYGTPTQKPEPDPVDPGNPSGGGFGFAVDLVLRGLKFWSSLSPENKKIIWDLAKAIWGSLTEQQRREIKRLQAELKN